jgi:hypothetical protein
VIHAVLREIGQALGNPTLKTVVELRRPAAGGDK